MPYNVKEPKKSVKSEWRKRAAEFETTKLPRGLDHLEHRKKMKLLDNGSMMMSIFQLTETETRVGCLTNYGQGMNQSQSLLQMPEH